MRRNPRQLFLILLTLVLLSFVSTANCENEDKKVGQPPIYLTLVDIPSQLEPFTPFFITETKRMFYEVGARAEIKQTVSTSTMDVNRREVVLVFKTIVNEAAPTLLGITFTQSPFRISWIFTAGVATMLRIDGDMIAWEPVAKRKYCTALAKVVVHETIHAILPRLGHVKGGLMSAGTNTVQLGLSHFYLQPEIKEWFLVELRMEERFKYVEE